MENACRICYGDDTTSLISPCRCSGIFKWVHVECFSVWIRHNANNIKSQRCEVCHYHYRKDVDWIGLKHILFVVSVASVALKFDFRILQKYAMVINLYLILLITIYKQITPYANTKTISGILIASTIIGYWYPHIKEEIIIVLSYLYIHTLDRIMKSGNIKIQDDYSQG